MVTGDHPITAQAIAEKVHIIQRHIPVAKLVKSEDEFENIKTAVEKFAVFNLKIIFFYVLGRLMQ